MLPLSTGVCDDKFPPGAVRTYSSRGRVGSDSESVTALDEGLAASSVTEPLLQKVAYKAVLMNTEY